MYFAPGPTWPAESIYFMSFYFFSFFFFIALGKYLLENDWSIGSNIKEFNGIAGAGSGPIDDCACHLTEKRHQHFHLHRKRSIKTKASRTESNGREKVEINPCAATREGRMKRARKKKIRSCCCSSLY